MSTGVVWIIVFAFIAWNLVSLWLVFAKAKRPGWLALIPIVNVIVLLRIADRSPFNILLFFIPVVSWIASFVMWIAVAKTFDARPGSASA